MNRLRRRLHATAESGFTLIELLVVMVMASIIGAIVMTAMVRAFTTTSDANIRVAAQNEAQRAMERLSRDVRVADPLVAALVNDMTLNVYHSGRCEEHRWRIDASQQLVLDSRNYAASATCATKTGTPGATTSSVIMKNTGVDSTTLIFRYYRANVTSGLLTELSAPVTASDLAYVDRVQITVKRLLPKNRNPVLVTTYVDLRNVERTP